MKRERDIMRDKLKVLANYKKFLIVVPAALILIVGVK